MKYLLIILGLFFSTAVFAQEPVVAKAAPDSMDLVSSIADLNGSLVSRDTVRLRYLLRDDLHYVHSNGWKQSKRDIIRDLYNGKLTYKKIAAGSQTIHLMGDIAQVKNEIAVEAVMDGKPIQLQLRVVQIWAWKNDHWSLFSRRSEKI